MTSIERVDPPLAIPEADTLLAFLDYHRDTLRMKVDGLSQEQLAQALAPSTMTLGGLMKHLALNEDHWFGVMLLGKDEAEIWQQVDWDADPNWEWRTANDDSPEVLRALFDSCVEGADRNIRQALAEGGMDYLSIKEDRREKQKFSLRWIVVHMIEEYARHNGHADLIRESVDGTTGE